MPADICSNNIYQSDAVIAPATPFLPAVSVVD